MDEPSRTTGSPAGVPDTLLRAHKLDAVARLVPGVIHELNNPLAAIVGFGELLRRDPSLPPDLQENAELLIRETARTRRIIQAVLEFLRARPPERVPTSIQALVDAVLLLHGYRLVASSVELDVAIPEGLPQVELDRGQIQLVLIDIVQEALDAIMAGGGRGRIRVAAALDEARDGNGVTLVVSWTAGQPEAVAADTATDPDVARQVARAVVAAHSGKLAFAYGDDGRPRSVTLALPVRGVLPESRPLAGALTGSGEDAGDVVAAMSMPRLDAEQSPAARATRVLVLDDERPIRMLLEKWLRAAGYEPVVVATGQEALEQVRASSFDAVLCDHRMAGMNGTEVFEAVVALHPEMAQRFVFMSGDVLNPQLREFVEAHGVGLLPKPFDLDTVRRTLEGIATARP